MSRVLENLRNLSASDMPPASAKARSVPALRRSRASWPTVAGVISLGAMIASGIFYWRSPAPRAPASAEHAAGISQQELFLRNRQAVLGFYNGNLEASAKEMRALVEEEKRRPKRSAAEAASLHANLGAVLFRQGKLTEARTAFVRALAQDPKSPAAHHGLGQVALRENELAEAEENFRLALAAAPERPEALLSLGQVAELKSDWPASRGYYNRFLASNADASLKAQIATRLRRIEERSPKMKEAE